MDSRNEEIQENYRSNAHILVQMGCRDFYSSICGMLLLGFLIHYPETVDGEISITATTAPTRLLAATTGRLHLVLARGTIVRKGEIIAYIESGMKIEDYYTIKRILVSRCNFSSSSRIRVRRNFLLHIILFILSLERWNELIFQKL